MVNVFPFQTRCLKGRLHLDFSIFEEVQGDFIENRLSNQDTVTLTIDIVLIESLVIHRQTSLNLLSLILKLNFFLLGKVSHIDPLFFQLLHDVAHKTLIKVNPTKT